MRRRLAFAGALLALGLSACGTSSTTGTSAAVTTAAPAPTSTAAPTTTAAADTGADAAVGRAGTAKTLDEARAAVAAEGSLTEVQAGCVIDELVDSVGEARTIDLVNDPRDVTALDPADGKAVVDSVLACITPEDLSDLIATSFYEELQDSGVTEAHAQCVGDKLMTLITPASLYQLGTGDGSFEDLDPADQGKLFQAVIECVPAEVLSQLAADNGADVGTGMPTTVAG